MGAKLYWPEGPFGYFAQLGVLGSLGWRFHVFVGKMRVEGFSTLGFGEVVDREKGRDEGDLT